MNMDKKQKKVVKLEVKKGRKEVMFMYRAGSDWGASYMPVEDAEEMAAEHGIEIVENVPGGFNGKVCDYYFKVTV